MAEEQIRVDNDTVGVVVDGSKDHINQAEIDYNIAKKRAGFSVQAGDAFEKQVGGVKLVGAAGVSVRAEATIGATPEEAMANHDRSEDTPLARNQVGVYEAKAALDEVMRMTGGNLGKITYGDANAIVHQFPNIITPSALSEVNEINAKLASYGINAAETAQAKTAISDLHSLWVADGSPQINYKDINQAIAKYDPGAAPLSGEAQLIANTVLAKSGGAIDKLYAYSQEIPATPTALSYVDNMTLGQINTASVDVQNFIAKNGGPAGITGSITSFINSEGNPVIPANLSNNIQNDVNSVSSAVNAITSDYGKIPALPGTLSAAQGDVTKGGQQLNDVAADIQSFISKNGGASGISASATNYLNSLKGPQLPAGIASDIQGGISKVNADAASVTKIYSELPSQADMKKYQRWVNDAVRYDPKVTAEGYVAGGAMTDHVKTAFVAQEKISIGMGNISYIAGDGVKIQPAQTRSGHVEVGTGNSDYTSLSPQVANKLNLSPPVNKDGYGAYLDLSDSSTRWRNDPANPEHKAVSVEAGLNYSKAVGREAVATVNVYVEETHNSFSRLPIDTPDPSNIPGERPNDRSAGVGFSVRFK